MDSRFLHMQVDVSAPLAGGRHSQVRWRGFWLTVLTISLCAHAHAQQPTAHIGTRDIALWGGAGPAIEGARSAFETGIWIAGANVAWVLAAKPGSARFDGTLEYGFGLNGNFFDTNGKRAFGGGMDPIILRWSFYRPLLGIQYIEAVGGGLFTNTTIPPGKTSSFNFFPRVGIGWTLLHQPRNSLDLKLAYWHLSNADLGANNPSLNGLQLQLAYHWLKLSNSN
jgi:Lipid A 3-O-deacylase (PagL)